MKALICLTAVIVLLSSYEIIVQNDPYASPNNPPITEIKQIDLKQFGNQSGIRYDQGQIRSMINIINNASSIYKDNIQMNLQYIKNILDANYATDQQQFNVVIDKGNTSLNNSRQIFWSIALKAYAYFPKGISLKNPTWSYLIYTDYKSKQGTYYYLPPIIGRGSDINQTIEDKLTFIIQANEGFQPCDCSKTEAISDGIDIACSTHFSIFCRADQSIHSYVSIRRHSWIIMKPLQCIYFIYIYF